MEFWLVIELRGIKVSAAPPNHGMQLTCQKRHALRKAEERRPRRFCHAADARR